MSALDESPVHGGRTDQTLLERIHHDADQDAAMAVFLRYSERLLKSAERSMSSSLSSRVDPDDIVQSVFRTFFRRASEGQYQVPSGEELWKLLLAISLNKVRSVGQFHRAAKRDILSSASLPPEDVLLDKNYDEISRSILELSVAELVSKLPESAQSIVRLRIDGYQVSQIALETQRSKRSVERVLQHFRSTLGRHLEAWV